MRLRNRPGIGPAHQRRLAWLMEVGLIGILSIGPDRGNTGITVNAGIGLLVTRLPPVLRRDYDVPMDAGLTLWITAAVFLHAFGTLGLPGSGVSFYQSVPWWDHLTHALSSSIVAAAGYATARAVDEHSDSVHLPSKFTFVFVPPFVLAFGVLWEVIEFGLVEAATVVGVQAPLTQYGLEDTMLDPVFDTLGAVVVALWGTAHLTGVVRALTRRLEARNPEWDRSPPAVPVRPGRAGHPLRRDRLSSKLPISRFPRPPTHIIPRVTY